jgi:hypothetical protein
MFLIKKMFIKLVTNLLQTLHNSLIRLVNLTMRQLSGSDRFKVCNCLSQN